MRDIHSIRTPENVEFELELAGVSARALALLVDLAVMSALLLLVAIVLSALGVVFGGLAVALYFMSAFAVQWGYGASCEWRFDGQTVGKRLVGIRVVSTDGTRIDLTQAVVRNLVRVVDLLPALYLVGGTSALVDGSGRRLGDWAAGTLVVRKRRSPRPASVIAPTDRHNSFLADPQVVQASSRITAREREVMIGLALRRESLPLAVRYALFSKLAQHLERRLDLARPSHSSEERYVLNLTAVLLSTSEGSTTGIAAPAKDPGRLLS